MVFDIKDIQFEITEYLEKNRTGIQKKVLQNIVEKSLQQKFKTKAKLWRSSFDNALNPMIKDGQVVDDQPRTKHRPRTLRLWDWSDPPTKYRFSFKNTLVEKFEISSRNMDNFMKKLKTSKKRLDKKLSNQQNFDGFMTMYNSPNEFEFFALSKFEGETIANRAERYTAQLRNKRVKLFKELEKYPTIKDKITFKMNGVRGGTGKIKLIRW